MKDYDKILTITEAKKSLLSHIKNIREQGGSLMITRNGEASAVMISPDEYEGLLETIEILSDPKILRILKKSIKEADHGQFISEKEVFS